MAHVDLNFVAKIALQAYTFQMVPDLWAKYPDRHGLAWTAVPFKPGNRVLIPDVDGVYAFCVRPGVPWGGEVSYLVYIGQTGRTLKKRYAEYVRESQGKGKPRPALSAMFQLYGEYLWFLYAPTPPNKAYEAEQDLLEAFWPPVNEELPAYLRPAKKALRR